MVAHPALAPVVLREKNWCACLCVHPLFPAPFHSGSPGHLSITEPIDVGRGCSLFYAETIIKRKIKLVKTGVEEARVGEGETCKQMEFQFIGEEMENYNILIFLEN